jgi:A/G-specific adenine glycosylase
MTRNTRSPITGIRRSLLSWYGRAARDLPWRRTRDPYRIWVSEIMLQQTQVDTVIPYYERFLLAFPTVEALAAAPLDDVLKLWENLGYYSRARHLHAAAGQVVGEWHGRLPARRSDLLRLPGVGPYVAGAVASIAFGEPVPAIDANVRRVVARLFAVREQLSTPVGERRLEELATSLVHDARPGDFNQALMDLGAVVCTPRRPACDGCPLAHLCEARRQGLAETLPLRTPRKPKRQVREVAAIIRNRAGEVLVVRRPSRGLLGGLWRFPGGAVGPREGRSAAVARTVREQTGLRVEAKELVARVSHEYTHFRTTVAVFQACRRGGRPAGGAAADERQWVRPEGLSALALAKIDREIAKSLRGL